MTNDPLLVILVDVSESRELSAHFARLGEWRADQTFRIPEPVRLKYRAARLALRRSRSARASAGVGAQPNAN